MKNICLFFKTYFPPALADDVNIYYTSRLMQITPGLCNPLMKYTGLWVLGTTTAKRPAVPRMNQDSGIRIKNPESEPAF
jgi:hypothetical protein